MLRSPRMMGAKGKLSEDDGSFDRAFWRTATPEEKVQAIFDLRELYHEVMHPEIGLKNWIDLLAESGACVTDYGYCCAMELT